jgi:tripartite-type tricarboxylate transporter receptor subunit TctC
VVERIAQALRAALKDPKVVQRFGELGTTPVAEAQATPEFHRQFWQAEIARWRPLIQAAGQYAD